MLGPALGQHIFLLGGEDREFLDLGEIAVETRLAAHRGGRRYAFTASPLPHSLPGIRPLMICRDRRPYTASALNSCCISDGASLLNDKACDVTGWMNPSSPACRHCRSKLSLFNNSRTALR